MHLRLQAQLVHMPGDMFSERQQACCKHKQAVLLQGSINSMDMDLSNTVLQRSQSRNGLARLWPMSYLLVPATPQLASAAPAHLCHSELA